MTDARRALTTILLSLSIVFMTLTTAMAQDEKITLPSREVSATEVFDAIRRQTDYELSINESRFDLSRKARLTKNHVTVSEVLTKLLDGTGMGYVVNGRYIIFPVGTAVGNKAKSKTTVKAIAEHTAAGQYTDTAGTSSESVKAKHGGRADRQEADSSNSGFDTDSVSSDSYVISAVAASREAVIPATGNSEVTFVTKNVALTSPNVETQPFMPSKEVQAVTDNAPDAYEYTGRGGKPEAGILMGTAPELNTTAYLPKVAVKTNLLYWGTTTPNIAVEVALGRKTTLDLQGSYNPWTFGSKQENKKLQHWMVMPEVRMWVYERFDGHFFGVHPLFISYNAGGVKMPLKIFGDDFRNSQYEGYGVGVGLSYGYQWYLGPHWNLEATFGFGYAYLNYDRYDCGNCGRFRENTHKHYFGPTKIGLSFIYLFKSKR